MTLRPDGLSPELYSAAIILVTAHHSKYDPSHDLHHVTRVHNLALRIATSIVPLPNLKVVSLASLFHDLLDKKYLPKDQPVPSAKEHLQRVFWNEHDLAAEKEREVSAEERDLIARVVENVSYSKEVKRIREGAVTEWEKGCSELHCVQDGDKLDAIGAFGIMRCAAFSAISNRALYLPDPSDATISNDSAIQHFHDKLFKLEGMMKTDLGRSLAKKRTETMRAFVESTEEEYREASDWTVTRSV